MVLLEEPGFDAAAFFSSAGVVRKVIQFAPKEAFISQGDPADLVFYPQKGHAKVTVVSPTGKEATIALRSTGESVGEGAARGSDDRPLVCGREGRAEVMIPEASENGRKEDPNAHRS